jgi:hypothetical protein
VEGRLRGVGEGVAVRAHGVALDHHAVSRHEVGVVLDEREGCVSLDLVNDDLQLPVDLLVGTAKGELGDPDGLPEQVVNVDEVLEEGVGVEAVDVDVDEVNHALAVASLEKALEPADSLMSGTAVGDGGSTDTSLASEGVHQLNVRGGSLLRREVGLSGVVGLVEAEESLGARIDHLLGVGSPCSGEALGDAPAHGDELKTSVRVVGLGPVVCPRDVRAAAKEATQKVRVVECETTSAPTSRSAAAGRSGGGSGLGRSRIDGGRADGNGLDNRGLYRRGGGGRSGSGGSRNCHRSGRTRKSLERQNWGRRGSRHSRRGAPRLPALLGVELLGAESRGRGSLVLVQSNVNDIGHSHNLGDDGTLVMEALVVVLAGAEADDVLDQAGRSQSEEGFGKHDACIRFGCEEFCCWRKISRARSNCRTAILTADCCLDPFVLVFFGLDEEGAV